VCVCVCVCVSNRHAGNSPRHEVCLHSLNLLHKFLAAQADMRIVVAQMQLLSRYYFRAHEEHVGNARLPPGA
jgi:hypothetical protein